MSVSHCRLPPSAASIHVSGFYLVLLAVPVFRTAIDTRTDGGLLPVNGYTAEYDGRSVSLYLAAVDIGQE